MRSRKRVSGGKERSQKVRNVRVHEGSEGWSVAQERELMRGWAPEVRGAMALRLDGRMSSLSGKRVGEMKALAMVSFAFRPLREGGLTAS
jgi:hypothetical protein